MKINRIIISLALSFLLLLLLGEQSRAGDVVPLYGPYAATYSMEPNHDLGDKNLLLIRVQFPDVPATVDISTAQSALQAVSQRYTNASYGRISLHPTVTSTVYMMPQQFGYYVTRNTLTDCMTAMMNDAVAAVSSDYAVDQTGGQWDRVGLLYPSSPTSIKGQKLFGNFGSLGTKWFWITDNCNPNVIVHELGHTCGSGHAALWKVADGNPMSPYGKSAEYGDSYDIMGSAVGYGSPYSDFSISRKVSFGWIDQSKVALIDDSPGTYELRVFRFDSPLIQDSGLLGIKVQRVDGSFLWIGVRRSWLNKPNEMTGAYIFTAWDSDHWLTDLIDCNTPDSSIADSALQVSQTLSDNLSGITVTPIGRGGIAPNQYMDIQVVKQ